MTPGGVRGPAEENMRMKNTAIRFHDYGGPEVMRFEEVERPVPKDGEILVRIHAVSVNPVDWKIRSGLVRKRFNLPLPIIPGGDLSGEVAAVGAAVADFAVPSYVAARLPNVTVAVALPMISVPLAVPW